MKRIVLRRPLRHEQKSCELEGVMFECPTYDVLVERSSVQSGNECLNGEERSQDTTEHSDESKDNGDACRYASCPVKVLLQRRTTVIGEVVSELLDLEGTVGSPPDGNLALDNLPVLHESGSPQDESGGIVRGVGRPK